MSTPRRSRYPYSTTAGGVNYIRNAIKVTIDAYNGTTNFHVVDPSDPIAQTIGRIFPELLKPLDAMPEDLRTRLRYPQQIFALQAAMFATFHMTNPAVFYNREDQWEIPSFDVGGKPTPMHPYYTIMKLPGETGPEYIQMLPFTPRGKDNLASWMVARSDGANYGKLAVFQFPKQTVIFGPRQVAARINQDQVDLAADHAVEPAGLRSDPGHAARHPDRGIADLHPSALPESRRRSDPGTEAGHRRVPEQHRDGGDARCRARADLPWGRHAAKQGGIAVAEGQPAPPATRRSGDRRRRRRRSLAEQARSHYQRALQAQREGNWALYGEEIKKLGEVLERMRKAVISASYRARPRRRYR